MSKEAVIIQEFNEKERKYEYFVKGFDVTESVEILLKRHKEEYDKEKNVFTGTQGFIEAQQLYEKQITDLEKKLAESESEIKIGEFWHSAYQGKQLDYDKVYAELRKSYDENEQLKQQLAEKEKEIERKNKTICGILDDLNDIEDCEFCEKVVTSSGFSNCIANCSLCAENYYNEMSFNSKHTQDKISFALEQLEKVKEKVENRNRGTRQGHSSVEYKDGYSGCCCEITDYIENLTDEQIENEIEKRKQEKEDARMSRINNLKNEQYRINEELRKLTHQEDKGE